MEQLLRGETEEGEVEGEVEGDPQFAQGDR
jgi:hypothetical protein